MSQSKPLVMRANSRSKSSAKHPRYHRAMDGAILNSSTKIVKTPSKKSDTAEGYTLYPSIESDSHQVSHGSLESNPLYKEYNPRWDVPSSKSNHDARGPQITEIDTYVPRSGDTTESDSVSSVESDWTSFLPDSAQPRKDCLFDSKHPMLAGVRRLERTTAVLKGHEVERVSKEVVYWLGREPWYWTPTSLRKCLTAVRESDG